MVMSLWSSIEHGPSPALRAGSVRVTRRVKAQPDRVFDAWLDAEAARTFLFALRTDDPVDSEMDPRVGGRFRIAQRGASGDVEYVGEFLAVDRPYRLVFSLFVEKYAQRDDRVMLELAPVGQESLLVLTHEYDLSSETQRARIQAGWETSLDGLASLCGEPAPRVSTPRPNTPGFGRLEADFV